MLFPCTNMNCNSLVFIVSRSPCPVFFENLNLRSSMLLKIPLRNSNGAACLLVPLSRSQKKTCPNCKFAFLEKKYMRPQRSNA